MITVTANLQSLHAENVRKLILLVKKPTYIIIALTIKDFGGSCIHQSGLCIPLLLQQAFVRISFTQLERDDKEGEHAWGLTRVCMYRCISVFEAEPHASHFPRYGV